MLSKVLFVVSAQSECLRPLHIRESSRVLSTRHWAGHCCRSPAKGLWNRGFLRVGSRPTRRYNASSATPADVAKTDAIDAALAAVNNAAAAVTTPAIGRLAGCNVRGN